MQLTPRHYADAWHQLAASASAHKRKQASRRVLAHLYRTNRLHWLSDIVRELEAIEYRQSGAETVVVRTSRAMPRSQAEKLAKKVLGSKPLSVVQKITPELLGGVQIETTNTRWDASLATRLSRAYNRLTSS